MTSKIIKPNAPPGMAKVKELYLPEPFANKSLDSNNHKLLSLKEELAVHSLETSILDSYISASKYTDEQGRVQYDAKKVSKEKFIDSVMESVSYHIHNRHFKNMPGELAKQVANHADFNGDKYGDIVVSALAGINRTALEATLEDNSISNQFVAQSAFQISRSYLSRQAAKTLPKMYKDDLNGMRNGLKNLGEVFGLDPQVFKIKDLPKLGEQELNQTYLEGLNTSWNKIMNPNQ